MGQVSAKLRRATGGYTHWCPGCEPWHELHHKFIRCNFGITVPFWDVVFGTYRRAPQ